MSKRIKSADKYLVPSSELLKKTTEVNRLLIDMHVHTSRHSACGQSTPESMAAAALTFGLDAIVLTDHDYIWQYQEWKQLQNAFPQLKIFRGIEVTSDKGEHYLVVGVLDPSALWPFMDERDLFAAVEEHGASIVLAHPYRYRDRLHKTVLSLRPHGVEYMSNNIRPDMQPRIEKLAEQYQCPLTASSDAHITDNVGLFAVRLPVEPQNEEELAAFLRTRPTTLELVPRDQRKRTACDFL